MKRVIKMIMNRKNNKLHFLSLKYFFENMYMFELQISLKTPRGAENE